MTERLIMGIQPVREAIRAHGSGVSRVLVERGAGPELQSLAKFALDNGISVSEAPRGELDRLAKGGRHQGVLAHAPPLSFHPIEALTLHQLVLLLDELEDPQNFGAILRSAVSFGAPVVFAEHHAAPLTPATFRASAGAVEHATLCRVPSLPKALTDFHDAGFAVLGLDANGPLLLSEYPRTERVAVVVGAEGKGLRKGVKQRCDALVRLPMFGAVRSLNASVAAGIALYEVIRTRS